MAGAEEELERRSKFLSSLIQKKKSVQLNQPWENVRVRAADMPVALQNKAFQCATDHLDSRPGKRIDSKNLALTLKKAAKTIILAQFFQLWTVPKNLILLMGLHGTALWARASVHMSLILLEGSCISRSIRFTSFSSEQL